MPWGRVDDTWYDHPKLDRLTDVSAWPDRLAAAGLDSLAWSWCNRFLTDGHVPRATVVKLAGPLLDASEATALADRLVAIGRWDRAADGYNIHDFLVYNDSREQVLARRQKEAERKALWRAGKRPGGTDNGTSRSGDDDVPPGVPPSVPPGHSSGGVKLSRGESRDSTRANPDPTRPDPTRPTESLRRGSARPRAADREDVAALLGRGWKRVSPAQLKVLVEVAGRHKAGPGFAAEVIRSTPTEADPLAAVLAADRVWQDAERRRILADEGAWAREKAQERADAARIFAKGIDRPEWSKPDPVKAAS